MINKTQVQNVVCYVTKGEKLLVFRHLDYSFEEVGIQVPAGTIQIATGETTEKAAIREVTEETGLKCFTSVKFLGKQTYDLSPYRFEIQERFFYHFSFEEDTPERWETQELHDGKSEPTKFECFWINLRAAHVLQSGQGSLLFSLFDKDNNLVA